MKKLLIPLILCALLLTACGGQEEDKGRTAVIGPKISAEQEAQKEAVRTAVLQTLDRAYDGELSVSVRTDRVEVSVLLSDPAYSADAEPPADWAAVKEETAETTLSLSDALRDLGDYRALIYLMDRQESILLTAFDAVLEGMSYEEVCVLLGGEGELLSSVEDGELFTEIYSWSDGGGASATVVFENGGMASKTQVGLEPSFEDFGPSSEGSSGGMYVSGPGASISIGGGVFVEEVW